MALVFVPAFVEAGTVELPLYCSVTPLITSPLTRLPLLSV
jgi:hypothetical protein